MNEEFNYYQHVSQLFPQEPENEYFFVKHIDNEHNETLAHYHARMTTGITPDVICAVSCTAIVTRNGISKQGSERTFNLDVQFSSMQNCHWHIDNPQNIKMTLATYINTCKLRAGYSCTLKHIEIFDLLQTRTTTCPDVVISDNGKFFTLTT
jgi:hypothetical protein